MKKKLVKPKHKYNARPTIRKGFRYASDLEARCAAWLDVLKSQGEILFYLKQVPLHLPGNTKLVCDFLVFWTSGECSFIDAKGVETEMFKLKKKQVEEIYGVEVEIWKRKK